MHRKTKSTNAKSRTSRPRRKTRPRKPVRPRNQCVHPLSVEDTRPLSDVELSSFWAALHALPSSPSRAALSLMASTGARPVECTRLQCRDYDPATGEITMPTAKRRSRTRHTRRLTLHPEVVAYLRQATPPVRSQYTQTHPLLSADPEASKPSPLTTRAIRAASAALAPRLQLPRLHPYRFRITFATRLARASGLGAVTELLGHSAARSAYHYLKATNADLASATSLLIPHTP